MDSNSGKASSQSMPEMIKIVELVDKSYPTPTDNFKKILDKIKDNYNASEIAGFAAHYLMSIFDPTSAEWRKAKSVLADVYYFHYMAHYEKLEPSDNDIIGDKVKDGLQDISGLNQESSTSPSAIVRQSESDS